MTTAATITITDGRSRFSGVVSSDYNTLWRYMVTAGVFWLSLVAVYLVPTAVVATYYTEGASSITTTAAITLEAKDNALFLDTKAVKSLLDEDDEDDRILQATQAMRQEIRALHRPTMSKCSQQRR